MDTCRKSTRRKTESKMEGAGYGAFQKIRAREEKTENCGKKQSAKPSKAAIYYKTYEQDNAE